MFSRLLQKIADKWRSIRRKAIIVNTQLGKKVFISKYSYCNNSQLGDYTSIGRNSTIINASLGKFCSVSWNVTIGATQHNSKRISTHAFPYIAYFGFVDRNNRFVSKTTVGHDVWVGANAIIMPGIKVGHGAIIGAGAVVTKDIPDFGIVAGVPAKLLRYRFEKDIIDRLLSLKWWDLEPDKIKESIDIWLEELDPELLTKMEQLCKS